MTSPQTLLAGRYRLLEPIGQGGMGRVWLATDEFLKRQVAVKEVVPPEGLSATEVRDMGARALREAQAAARLSHPNVVTVYDIVVTDTAPWIVMEFLQSRSLLEIVTQDGPMPVPDAAKMGLAVLAALRAAHGVGVLHRDVKPSNVLIEPSGRVVLTDFGLAIIVGDPSVTRTGMVIGSPSYMAPERARDAQAGEAADLWSLGATLYFAVEGRSPYQRASALATVAALASEDPDPPVQAGRLKPVLDGLLRRDPATRLEPRVVERLLKAASVVDRVVPKPAPALAPKPLTSPAVAAAEAVPVERTPMDTYLDQVKRHWGLWPAAFVAIAVLIAGLTWGLTATSGATTTVPDPSAGPVATSTPTPTSGSTSAPTAPTSPAGQPSATTRASGVVLPAGWHMYTDSTGFSVAVPESWPVTREGTIVYFREPGGAGRVLGIDQTNKPIADPVADWTGKEQYRVNRGDFPQYQRVRIEAVSYFMKAADWEFSYLRGGARVHVNNRGFITSPTRAYGMWWSTPDSRWTEFHPDLELIQRSFVPA